MGKRLLRRLALLTGIVALAVAGPEGAAAQKAPVEVGVERAALLVGQGEAVTVTVRVRCATGLDVLEANLSVSQNNASGFTGFGGFTCNGRRQTRSVTVSSFGDPFVRGHASASAFVLVIDPDTQQTHQGQQVREIRVR